MKKPIRFGLLGTGNIARIGHVPGSMEIENAEIIAAGSRNLQKATAFATDLKVQKAYGSYEELLADPEIDAVVNTLPNSLHCAWTVKSLEAGKHVLCEKPFAVSVAEAEEMAGVAKAKGLYLMEAFTHRFSPGMKRVRELIQDRTFGRPLSAHARLSYDLGEEGWLTDSRSKLDLAGGALMDCGSYLVSALRFALGSEVKGVAASASIREPNKVDGSFHGLLEFESGCHGYMFSSMEGAFDASVEIWCESGSIRLPNFFSGSSVITSEKEETFEERDRFSIQMEHFADCISRGKELAFTTDDAVENTRVINALKQAYESGNKVFLR